MWSIARGYKVSDCLTLREGAGDRLALITCSAFVVWSIDGDMAQYVQ